MPANIRRAQGHSPMTNISSRYKKSVMSVVSQKLSPFLATFASTICRDARQHELSLDMDVSTCRSGRKW